METVASEAAVSFCIRHSPPPGRHWPVLGVFARVKPVFVYTEGFHIRLIFGIERFLK
jgi:hypothetical protein